jgi:hypothetical protein
MKEKIEQLIYTFFVESNDFNGIPLRDISEKLKIEYQDSIDIITELVRDKKVSIQSSTNPHIVSFRHYEIGDQIHLLNEAKNHTIEYKNFGNIKIGFENTEYPICLYPSPNYLKDTKNLENFEYAHYSKKLALAEPQLKPHFFDIEVLERYFNDPRFDFDFDDYSGSISCKYDDQYNPLVRNEDNIYIKSFGIGFDENGNRLAVVFLRYLHNLTGEHQILWKSKEQIGNCRVLEEYYKNSIEGNWSFSHSIFSAFLEELKCLNEISKQIFGVNLFVETFEEHKKPKEFTFFFIPTAKNYHDFIHLLDKMISENINRDFFKEKIELFTLIEQNGINIKETKGTLRLLEEWLTSIFNISGQGSISDILKSFKKIRKERQSPAHKVIENTYDKNFIDKQKSTISEVYNSMRQLRNIFHQHPKAKSYVLPNWLENGKILNL